MNVSLYIAGRMAARKSGRFSGLIIRIAVAAIAISVAVMILATALIGGFKQEIRQKIFGFWGHIHVMHTSSSHLLDQRPLSLNQPFYPSLDTVRGLSAAGPARIEPLPGDLARGGISHIQAFAMKPAILKANDLLEGLIIKGIGPDFDWKYLEAAMEEGSVLQMGDTVPGRNLLISRTTADRMLLEVGDAVILNFVLEGRQLQRRFEVGGIYKTGLEDYDKRFALADIRVIQQLLGWDEDEVGGFEVFLDDLDDLDIYREYLLREVLPVELYAETIRDKDPAIFDWLDLQDINEAVILILMVIVSIINMITALLILILERTTMIGVLKALGASDWTVRKVFLYNAAVIISTGLLIGNILGFSLGALQDHFRVIRLSEADYYLSYAPICWDWPMLAALNAGTLLITLLALLIPSYLVSSVNPVRAIRFR
ncbi:MAG: ABC transporter permease [Saprospiraceae bacterium]